ncbi:myosin-9 [Drosophila kikkawai]|uniref:Myosin-9 n=1 Tax=Drosophila kikkawai TaxID=30033 RepID=A0ABM3C8T2_DROKI|nr:cingulin [Drosophila kikkawai]
MNTPGMSLFQGADTLNVNSTLDRQEEEEALQDQKRRDEELGHLLENAFDDLDDEENTIDSTTNSHSELPPPRQPLAALNNYSPHSHAPVLQKNQQQQQQHHANEMHRMKMMVESKTKELENVNQMATSAHKQLDEFQKRLTIMKAELDRALREKQNTHELLVETKERCSNQESGLEKLRAEKKQLEEDNTRLVGQLEITRTMLSDVQCKYDMVQRETHKREERNAELRVRQMEDAHRAQCELLQQQLSQLTDQLDRKKMDLEQMHSRYNALQSGHETMLADKAAKINELNQALDVAQMRCKQVNSRADLEAEVQRQQRCIAEQKARIVELEQTIAVLNERVTGTTAELDLMDTLLQQHHADESPTGRLSQVGGSRLIGSTPLNPVDRVNHIKQELYRALGNLKSKREEVRRLEKQLEERNQELRLHREQENKSLVQLATLKEEKMRLDNKVKVMQQELEEQQHRSQQDSRVQSQLDDLMMERDSLKKECQQVDEQLKTMERDMDQLKQQCESLQRNNEELTTDNMQLRARPIADDVRLELERHKILLKDAQSEVERLKKLYTDIATDKESLDYELRKLREVDTLKELQEHRQKLATAQRNLQLAELKSQELSKLLETAKLGHERDIQALRQKSERDKREEAANKENSGNCSKCLESLAEITKAEIRMLKLQNVNSMQAKELKELEQEVEQAKALQSEMQAKVEQSVKQEGLINDLKEKVKQFEAYIAQQEECLQQRTHSSPKPASDSPPTSGSPPELTQERIRRIEQRVRDEMAKLFAAELKKFTGRLQQLEERNQCLQREYQAVCTELQQRQTEVDLLKQTILAERENIQELLIAKDDKQKVIMEKCRQELHAKNERIAKIVREFNEHQASIESERQSMKAVMAQWEEQRKSVDQVENHWRQQLESLRTTHEEAMKAAQQRYQSAKRTAHNYKLYAEDKEAHMKREYERIKNEYDLSLAKIEATMNQHLERQSRERLREKENEQPSNSTTSHPSRKSNGNHNGKSKSTGNTKSQAI